MTEPTGIDSIRYFGNYLILGEHARGGMGVVYLAQQTNLNREVALKLIRAGGLASLRELQMFQVEAEAAAALSHPNIVRIYETGTHDGQPFVAMEFVEGASLAQQIAAGQWRWEPTDSKDRLRRAVALLAKLADAVQHAHDRGVIHRDLKPANVLINAVGEPFLTDFGLAKLAEGNSGLTQTGQVLGTPAYMAPEQAVGRTRDITTATDVYGLGAILYELLAGTPPFAGANQAEVLRKVVTEEPAPPSRTVPDFDRDLETICLKCIEKEPARRYSSARAMGDDLGRWLRGEPILARPVTIAERLGKWVRRHPAIAALLATVVIGSVASATTILWQWRRAEQGWSAVRQANTRLQLQRAEEQFARGDSSSAFATLARALRDDSKNRVVEERLVNALRARRFFIPLAARSHSFDLGQSVQALARRAKRGSFSADSSDAANIIVSRQGVADERFILTPPRPGVIRHVSVSPDTHWVGAAVSDAGVCVWDIHSRKLTGTFPHATSTTVVEFGPTATFVASGAEDGKIRLWSLQRNEPIREFPSHQGPVNALRFTTNGVLISAGEDGVLRAWYAESARAAIEPLQMGEAIDGLEIGADGTLAVRLRGNVVRHFALPTLPSARESVVIDPKLADSTEPSLLPIDSVLGAAATNFHTQEITFTNLSPDGRFVVTASMDASARVWDARTRQPVTPLMAHGSTVNHARFSPDGRRIATSTAGGQVRVWDAATGIALTDPMETQGDVFSVRFSENGRDVIASNGQQWSIHHGEQNDAFDWLPPLAEALAGRRLSPAGVAETARHDEAAEFCRQVSTNRSASLQQDWLRKLLLRP